MPELGPMGRGGARRRTRRRMMAVGAVANRGSDQGEPGNEEPPAREEEAGLSDDSVEKLEKLAKLLKDKGVITESEYNLLFG
jgi:hypothetical protein